MRFFQNVLSTFLAEVMIVGTNFCVGVLVARLLPPPERGVLALVMLFPVTLAYFADIGISQAIVYQIGRKQRSPGAVAGTAILLAILISSLAVLVAWLARRRILETFLNGVPQSYLAIALGLLPLLLVDTYLLSVLRARQQFALFNLRRVLTPIFLLIGIVLWVGAADRGVQGALIAFAASTILSLGIAIWLVGSQAPLSLRFDRELAAEAAGFGLKSYLQNLVGHLNYRLDIYLLALFLPPTQVAFYAVATSVAEAAFYIPDSVGTVLFPRLSTERLDRIHILTAEVSRHTILVSGLASIGILLAGRLLIPLVYGPAYQPAVVPFMILMPGILAMAVYKVLTRNFSSRNRQQVSVLAASIALFLNVAINLFLIPRFGVEGAALASLLSYTASAAVLLAVFRKESGIPIRQILVVQPGDLARYAQVASHLKDWLTRTRQEQPPSGIPASTRKAELAERGKFPYRK